MNARIVVAWGDLRSGLTLRVVAKAVGAGMKFLGFGEAVNVFDSFAEASAPVVFLMNGQDEQLANCSW